MGLSRIPIAKRKRSDNVECVSDGLSDCRTDRLAGSLPGARQLGSSWSVDSPD